MTLLQTPEQARRFVAYWAQEGATWLKSYTDIRRAELKAAIDEAHKQGIKVTGHLCSVSFLEAVEMGIDGLEHGLYANSDYVTDKQPDVCPTSMVAAGAALKPNDPQIQRTFQGDDRQESADDVHAGGVRAVRAEPADQGSAHARGDGARSARRLPARPRADRQQHEPRRLRRDCSRARWRTRRRSSTAGGLMGAGVDPTGNGGALPGYGDQRNFELLREAGFTPEQVVQIMSLNGARILGVDKDLGSVEKGKIADLVVMRGDLTSDPSVIRQMVTVFKDGIGYDSVKLLESVRGRVGIM